MRDLDALTEANGWVDLDKFLEVYRNKPGSTLGLYMGDSINEYFPEERCIFELTGNRRITDLAPKRSAGRMLGNLEPADMISVTGYELREGKVRVVDHEGRPAYLSFKMGDRSMLEEDERIVRILAGENLLLEGSEKGDN